MHIKLLRSSFAALTLAFGCGGHAHDERAPAQAQGGTSAAGHAQGGSATSPSGGAAGQVDVARGGTGGSLPTWTLPQRTETPWRGSVNRLCASDTNYVGWSLWSDANTLYAAMNEDPLSEGRLMANSGEGWELVPTSGRAFYRVSGVPGGPLLLMGGQSCSVFTLDGDASACISNLPSVDQVMSAGASRTFALAGNRLLYFNGSYLTSFGAALPEAKSSWPPYQLWVGSESVVVAGDAGRVWLIDPTGAQRELSIPDGKDAYAVWASGENDIWVGAEDGRLAHYGGADWALLATGNCAAVRSLWGTPDALFVAGGGFFGRVQEGQLEALFDEPCVDIPPTKGNWELISFGPLWGNSAKEVFTVVTMERYEQRFGSDDTLESTVSYPDCGRNQVYWFDGESILPM